MIAFFILLLGLAVGSFLNVVIYRLPEGLSIVKPRSRCPACAHELKPWENIPVLSYALLRGKCSQCGVRISFRYPLIELLTGIIFLLFYWRFGIGVDLIVYLFFICLVIAITFIDIDLQIIPNILLMIGLIPAVYPMFRDGWPAAIHYLIGAVSMGLFFYLIGVLGKLAFKQDAMGMGDVKYAIVYGLLLGWKEGILVTGLGFLSSALLIVILMPFSRVTFGQRLPFGPFLSLGILITIMRGHEIISWYTGFLGY